tara:strand:- start:343 stop:825 length:483 start_codon:yes stop_codon:yes gene_type:complete
MHHKQNNKEIKSFVQGLRPFGNTLPRGVRGILRKNGYNYSEIISKWNFLVGKNIANSCFPKSIKMSQENKNGTLILSVQRGDEINVEYSKKEIINKINSYFGYKLIDQIRLQTYNSKKIKEKKQNILNKSTKVFEKKINEIKNEDIKNSLSQLLDMIKND